MPNLRELRKRRKSVGNTRKITRTMELVASSKARKAQEAAEAAKPYADGLADLAARLAGHAEGARHPLMDERPAARVAVLVATSDRGLCGSFNANVIRHTVETITAHRAAGRAVELVTLGKKGASTLRFFGHPPAEQHAGLIDSPRWAEAEALLAPWLERFLDGTIDRVEVLYPEFVSAARFVPTTRVLLPAGGTARDGACQPIAEGGIALDYLFEPDPVELLAWLIPQSVKTAFFAALLETAAGEHNARRMAMKNATDAASDILKSLNRIYNRARQGKITQEIAEIVGAVEAMS